MVSVKSRDHLKKKQKKQHPFPVVTEEMGLLQDALWRSKVPAETNVKTYLNRIERM